MVEAGEDEVDCGGAAPRIRGTTRSIVAFVLGSAAVE
jgi:hypothetical protein